MNGSGSVPEVPPVGTSKSNGRAERAVELVEDKARTHWAALEARLKARIPMNHPVMLWLIEYMCVLLTKYSTHGNGNAPYAELHGHPVRERTGKFGERVLCCVPKAKRARMNL